MVDYNNCNFFMNVNHSTFTGKDNIALNIPWMNYWRKHTSIIQLKIT
jgi:hypothetical protein